MPDVLLVRAARRASGSRRTPDAVRTAGTALTLMFALSGAVFASWAVRIPDVSERVGASHAALGVALLCVSLGAVASMQVSGRLSDRLGPGRLTTLAAALLCVVLVAPALAPSVTSLGVVLLGYGAATGLVNVAMNSVGVRLERATARPVMPRLHAAFSLGGLLGSVLGAAVAGQLSPARHLLLVAAVGLAGTAALARRLARTDTTLEPQVAPSEGESPAPAPRPGLRGPVLVLGAIAGCTAYGEGALSDWATLHLTTDLDAPADVAATGFAGFSLAMAVGRLSGRRLLERLGQTRVLVLGSVTAATGMLLAALAGSVATSIAGLMVVGLGLANVFPVAIGRAGAVAGSRGVALASSVGYTGLLAGPPLIGLLAARLGLPVALTTVSGLALVAAVLAVAVSGRASALAALPLAYRERLGYRTGALLVRTGRRLDTAARTHADGLLLLAPEASLDRAERGPRNRPAVVGGTRTLTVEDLLAA